MQLPEPGPRDGVEGAQPQRGAVGDRETPGGSDGARVGADGLRSGSGQCTGPPARAGYCKPPLFINMLSAQIYSAGRHLLLAFTRVWRRVMNEPTALPPLRLLSSPSSASGPAAPSSPSPPADTRPQGEPGAQEPRHRSRPTPATGAWVPRSPLQRREAAGWPFKAFFFLSC